MFAEKRLRPYFILIAFLALTLVGCSSTSNSQITPTSDPFAYCASVGTIDAPDARYTGPSMPDAILQAMIRAGIVSADAPADFQKHAIWRCMDGQVWVCHFGANLPCQEKADLSKIPTSAMIDFCKSNPNAEDIPAAVTGRSTVYAWSCKDGKAQAGKQLFHADRRGYLAEFWHALSQK